MWPSLSPSSHPSPQERDSIAWHKIIQCSYQAIIRMTIPTEMNSCFPCNSHKRESWLWVIHPEGFTSQQWLNASQFDQVLEFQAALVYGTVAKLLQETLESVPDSKAVQAASFLDLVAMWLGKAGFVAKENKKGGNIQILCSTSYTHFS